MDFTVELQSRRALKESARPQRTTRLRRIDRNHSPTTWPDEYAHSQSVLESPNLGTLPGSINEPEVHRIENVRRVANRRHGDRQDLGQVVIDDR